MSRLLSLALVLALPSAAVIVDRIVISAGNRVITASEVELRLRLTAFESGQKPEFSLDARKKAAQRLIDQKLIEREMEVGHYPQLTGEDRRQPFRDFADQFYKSDYEALAAALKAASLNLSDLEEDLARQADLLTFLSLRFRPAVQVSEEDVRKRAEANKLSLSEFRAQLEQKLASELADADLETWVKEQRRRTRIEYLDKELVP